MSQYFPKPYEPFGGDINVKVDLSNYATKAYIKNISHVDTSRFAIKSNLASLKTEVDKIDIDKLIPVPVDLSKLSDVVKNDDGKKAVYDKVVEKANNIDNSGIVSKIKYDSRQKIKLLLHNFLIVNLFQKLITSQAIQSQKRKFLILVNLLTRLTIMLKLLKQKIKYLISVI